MSLELAQNPLPNGRDIVVFPRGAGWGFVPDQHTIMIIEEQRTVYLAIPDHGSGFVLDRVEEVPGELRVHVGDPTGDAHAVGAGRVPPLRAYRFPQIQEELQRLKTVIVNSGGRPQEADAWAQGASHDSHTAQLRARIRQLQNR